MRPVSRASVLFRLLGAGATLLFLAGAFTPAVGVVESWLQPDRAAEHAEAIVVLGAGGVTRAGRLTASSLRGTMEAVSLYREGWAPVLVFSGGHGRPRTSTEAEARADFARQAGVPPSAIVIAPSARTTHDEGVLIQHLLHPLGLRKILLVVDGPGTVRATAVFRRVGFDVVPAPWSAAINLEESPEQRLEALRAIAMELVARFYYRLMGYV